MIFTVCKRFTFAASHRLTELPHDHQCSRLHGHNYAVLLELRSSTLDTAGMVVDFGALGGFRAYIDETLDHHHLNDVLPDIEPTAECVALHLLQVAERLYPGKVWAVTVEETPTSWARVQH